MSSVTTVTARVKGKTVRIYQDQWDAAAAYGASQQPPAKPEDVIRWWIDQAMKAQEDAQ